MKLELTTEGKPAFKPFSITIHVETIREAQMLKALTDSPDKLLEIANGYHMVKVPSNFTIEEINKFDNIWKLITDSFDV